MRGQILEGMNDKDASTVVFVLRDLHNLMVDARTRRCIRDIKEYRSLRYLPIIVIAPTSEIHTEVAKLFRVVDYDLPDKEIIQEFVYAANERMQKALDAGKEGYQVVPKDKQSEIVNACMGLTQKEIEILEQNSNRIENTSWNNIFRRASSSSKHYRIYDNYSVFKFSFNS